MHLPTVGLFMDEHHRKLLQKSKLLKKAITSTVSERHVQINKKSNHSSNYYIVLHHTQLKDH